jgi:hypothetical protein
MQEPSPEEIKKAWIESHTIELPHIPGKVSPMQKFEAPYIHGYEFKVENPGEMNTYFIQLEFVGKSLKHYWIMPHHKMIGLTDVGNAINEYWNMHIQMNQMGWLPMEGAAKGEPEEEFKGDPFEGDDMFKEAFAPGQKATINYAMGMEAIDGKEIPYIKYDPNAENYQISDMPVPDALKAGVIEWIPQQFCKKVAKGIILVDLSWVKENDGKQCPIDPNPGSDFGYPVITPFGTLYLSFQYLYNYTNIKELIPDDEEEVESPYDHTEINPFEGDPMFQEAVGSEEEMSGDIGVDIGIGNIPSKEVHKGDTVVINTGALKLDWGMYQDKIVSMIGKPYTVLMIQDGPTPQADLWIENHHWMIPVTVLTKISSSSEPEEDAEAPMANPFEGDEMFKEGIGDEKDWNDDSDEDYEYKHEHSGIEIGDIVKVVYKAHEYEGGWNTDWLPDMDAWVGGEFEVVGDEYDGGWTLRDPKSGQMWAFPYFSLQIVKKVDKKEKKKKQMQYLKAHNASGFKVGDVVLVTTEATSYEKGWGYDWNEYMTDELVGNEFEIMEDDGVMGFIVQTEDGQQYHVPYFVLQKEGSAEETPNPFEGDDMFKEAVPPKVQPEYSRDPFGAENKRQDAERKKTQMAEPRPQEDESIVPDDFLFESKIIFISNLEEIPKALGDRVLAIQLNYNKEQALNLIDEKLQTLVPEYPELTIEHKREILAFLRKYKNSAKHISLRTFVHIASIWASNDPEKEKWALVQLQSQV